MLSFVLSHKIKEILKLYILYEQLPTLCYAIFCSKFYFRHTATRDNFMVPLRTMLALFFVFAGARRTLDYEFPESQKRLTLFGREFH